MTTEGSTANSVMLCLAGRQPMPNVNAALFFRPARVEILASDDTRQVAQHTLEALREEGICGDWHTVDPYDMLDTRDRALGLAGGHGQASLILNITGGTKMMSIGLYSAALDPAVAPRDLSVVYLDPQGDRIIHLPPAEEWYYQELRVFTRIFTYLLAHGWKIVEKRCADPKQIPAQWFAAAREMAAAGLASHELVLAMRKARQGKTMPALSIEALSPSAASLLHALEDAGLVRNVQRGEGKWLVSNPGTEEWKFLDGDWLEAYVWDALSSSGACDEVRMGVWVSNPKGVFQEMDVLATRSGRMLYISCKTTRRSVTEYLNEVKTVADIAGGLNCSRVFVTNGPSPVQDPEMREFEIHARDRRVVALYNDDLPALTERLVDELVQPTRPPL